MTVVQPGGLPVSDAGTGEERAWASSRSGSSASGKTSIIATCPFCKNSLTIFVWSFAGHGKKRCTCGAVLYRDGVARKAALQALPARVPGAQVTHYKRVEYVSGAPYALCGATPKAGPVLEHDRAKVTCTRCQRRLVAP